MDVTARDDFHVNANNLLPASVNALDRNAT
jgi:hypothetical protein